MSQKRLPPPDPEACLVAAYSSSQKGGTLIDETCHDLAAHQVRLGDPDAYRPERCPKCGCSRLHAHDYRSRKLAGDPDATATQVRRYRCASAACEARWQVLPRLLCRWLWRRWRVVEQTLAAGPASTTSSTDTPPVPPSTVRRWSARFASAARMLVQALATSHEPRLEGIARQLEQGATRESFVRAAAALLRLEAGATLAALAALVHRLVPGIRLM